MKVLILAPRTGGVGGIAQHVRALARRLTAQGVEAHLISAETLGTPRLRRLANPLYAAASTGKALLRSYDVVHGHNLPSLPAVLAAQGARILTLHGHYSRQVKLLHGEALAKLASLAEKTMLRAVDAVTTVTRRAAEEYRAMGVHPVHHIPNAVELGEIPGRGEGERVQEPQVIYLGRLSREKGVDLLVKAAENGFKGLLVAGEGPLRPLVEHASRLGLLRYLGPLPRPKALKLLAGSDLAVIPSREEGVSTFILEAMAAGVPVIATRVGGNVEVVRDGVEGVLVEPEPRALAEAVEKLLESPVERERLAENARKRVEREFSWDAVAPRYLGLYRRLVEERLK